MISKKFSSSAGTSIRDSMIKIEKNKMRAIAVNDKENRIIGFATDGDIRRYLLKGGSLDDNIEACMNKNFQFLLHPVDNEKLLKFFDSNITCLPVLDNNEKLVDLVDVSSVTFPTKRDIIIRTRVPLRMGLAGGGTDLNAFLHQSKKGAVLNAALNLFVRCSLKPIKERSIIYKNVNLNQNYKFQNLEDLLSSRKNIGLLKAILETVKPKFGFELSIESDIRPNSGLGGSTAFVVAILASFNELRNFHWSHQELVEMAFKIERVIFKNNGGWQDQYSAVYGGVNFIEFDIEGNQIYPLNLPEKYVNELEESCLLCDLESEHNSGLMQNELEKHIRSKLNLKSLNSAISNCLAMKKALINGEIYKIGDLLSENWMAKKQFSSKISDKLIDDFFSEARDAGANGGKLLGAGGAGFFLLFVEPFSRIKIEEFLVSKNVRYHRVNIAKTGIKSWIVQG